MSLNAFAIKENSVRSLLIIIEISPAFSCCDHFPSQFTYGVTHPTCKGAHIQRESDGIVISSVDVKEYNFHSNLETQSLGLLKLWGLGAYGIMTPSHHKILTVTSEVHSQTPRYF